MTVSRYYLNLVCLVLLPLLLPTFAYTKTMWAIRIVLTILTVSFAFAKQRSWLSPLAKALSFTCQLIIIMGTLAGHVDPYNGLILLFAAATIMTTEPAAKHAY